MIGFWAHPEEKPIQFKTCNGEGGAASLDGQNKSWTYAKKRNRTYLTIIDGTNNLEFLVHNLTQEGNISLELTRKGATQSRFLRTEQLEVRGCNTRNSIGEVIYNGNIAIWRSSPIQDEGMIMNVMDESQNLLLKLKVHNPLSKNNISLEIMNGNGLTGNYFKPTQ